LRLRRTAFCHLKFGLEIGPPGPPILGLYQTIQLTATHSAQLWAFNAFIMSICYSSMCVPCSVLEMAAQLQLTAAVKTWSLTPESWWW